MGRAAIYFRVGNVEQLGNGRSVPQGASVAVYCRTATTSQGEPSTLDAQEARCRAEAQRRGLVVAGVYRDQGSGLSLDRPALGALRAAVARGEVAAVLVADYDRLARDMGAYAALAHEWKRAGVALVIVGDSQ
jgi:DNA invertase Pin-like site-specific DNA recombinase